MLRSLELWLTDVATNIATDVARVTVGQSDLPLFNLASILLSFCSI